MSTPLQNKLSEYAPQPPQKVWDAVARALEENSVAFPKKLNRFEVAPPSGVWEKISQQLSDPAASVNTVRRPNKFLQYSAAAALLFAVLATTLLINQKTSPTVVATTPPASEPQKNLEYNGFSVQPSETKNRTVLAVVSEEKTAGQKKESEEKNPSGHLRPQLQLGSIAFAHSFVPRTAKPKQTVNGTAEKYMIYSDDNGNAMRLSKKLFDFMSCVKEDASCQEELQQLQRMSFNVLPADFTGVLETLKSLKENQ